MTAMTPLSQHAPRRQWLERYYQVALHPLVILTCVAAGAAFGHALPAWARSLEVLGQVFVELLKMLVMPFMVTAIVFSLQQLFREGGASRMLGRLVGMFLIASVLATALACGLAWLSTTFAGLSDATRDSLGSLVGTADQKNHLRMFMYTIEAPPKALSAQDIVSGLIPSNIFGALAQGEALQVLMFAVLFGVAIGKVPHQVSAHLASGLEAIYRACQLLTRWINHAMPLVLFCLSASQVAAHGLAPIRAMASFVLTFTAVAAVCAALSILYMSLRSGRSLRVAANAMRETFAVGIATNNAASCMPAMIGGLTGPLGFNMARVELLVPLTTTLLRLGAMAFFACATLFIADLYERPLALYEIALVVVLSIVTGFASAGMAGIVTLTLLGTITGMLGLPFEAALVLLISVDAICAMERTVITVIGGAAVVSAICARPDAPTSAADSPAQAAHRAT